VYDQVKFATNSQEGDTNSFQGTRDFGKLTLECGL
jgi:hypothetical protein